MQANEWSKEEILRRAQRRFIADARRQDGMWSQPEHFNSLDNVDLKGSGGCVRFRNAHGELATYRIVPRPDGAFVLKRQTAA
jgi:hypothetical protein